MKDKYDAIIIGAGIGGLVCGSYLAKAGMKVLIVEQHHKVGGYCTSFSRKGFTFDAAVHSLRGLREKNQLGIVFNDLKLKNSMSLMRINPADIIFYKERKVCVYNSIKSTVESIKSAFPNQREEIKNFFSFLLNTNFTKLYKLTYKKTFSEILDTFFSNSEIKTFFNILLGNLALDGKYLSAISALVFYYELFTDNGYYPKSGLQAFPDSLAQKFHDYGGNVLLSTKVEKISVKNNIVEGVCLKNNRFVRAKIVVSNLDAYQTYLKLVGSKNLDKKFRNKLKNLRTSPSAFIVYLGVAGRIHIPGQDKCSTLWYFPSRKSTTCYERTFNGKVDTIGTYSICGLSSLNVESNIINQKSALSLTSVVPWKSKNFWERTKNNYAQKVINKACEVLNIDKSRIEVKEIATPFTLRKYTYNHNGAACGWASLPGQISRHVMPQKSRVNGMYLCGHWATRGWGQGGISMVVNSGRTTANMILKSCKYK